MQFMPKRQRVTDNVKSSVPKQDKLDEIEKAYNLLSLQLNQDVLNAIPAVMQGSTTLLGSFVNGRFSLPARLAQMDPRTLERLSQVEFTGGTTEFHLLKSVATHVMVEYAQLKVVIENLTTMQKMIEQKFMGSYTANYYDNGCYQNANFKTAVSTTLNLMNLAAAGAAPAPVNPGGGA